MIREVFKKTNPTINNKKLIIFNGIPPKKIYEHNAVINSTLADLKFFNNSILRFDIDEDNFTTESYLNNSDNVQKQQKEFDKYAESMGKGRNSGVSIANKDAEDKGSFNNSYSGNIKEEKREDSNFV
jgi:hypothetical protein